MEQLGSTDDDAKRAEILKQLQALEQEKLYKLPLGVFSINIYINDAKIDTGNTVFGNPLYNYQNNFATI